jgi:hypothetical protein
MATSDLVLDSDDDRRQRISGEIAATHYENWIPA